MLGEVEKRKSYGRVQRAFSGTQAMPTLEQALLPSFCRAQIRQPSVHSRQFAGKLVPCAAGAGRGFGTFRISAALAVAIAIRIQEKPIKRFRMTSKPKFAGIPFILPAGEPAVTELQIKPLLDPGWINARNGRRLPHHIDFRVAATRDIAWARTEGRRHFVGRHAESQQFAGGARAAERKPPDTKKCDDPPHPQTIS